MVGATLVVKVCSRWGKRMSPNGFRVLTTMAVTALDNPTDDVPASMYFAGHDLLAMALKDSDTMTVEARKKAVQVAVKEIVAVGAAELVQKAKANGNAIYRLTLDNEPGFYRRDLKKLAKLLDDRVETTSPPDMETDFYQWGGDDGSTPGGDVVSTPGGDVVSTPIEEPLEEPLEELGEEKVLAVRAHLAPPGTHPPGTAGPPGQDRPPPVPLPWPTVATPGDPHAGRPPEAAVDPPDGTLPRCIHRNNPDTCVPCWAVGQGMTIPSRPHAAHPDTCPQHGRAFKAGQRPDGKPWCPLCRAVARTRPPETQLSILEAL